VQIEFFFTCRECGAAARVPWDTSDFGKPVKLECSSFRCGHVSGELTLGYVYREEHRPSWEREAGEGPGSNGR